MNLTSDMQQLKQTADKIHENKRTKNWLYDTTQTESYFKSRNKHQKQALFEYEFQTPMELRNQLQELWSNPEKEYLTDFIPICMVASSKCRPAKDNNTDNHSISPYIYVF